MAYSDNITKKEEALLSVSHHSISLRAFHGPLDLLLFLIRKNEIDIYDIPIEEVTKQYLAMLHSYNTIDLELTGDFFVVASTLMLIKSRLLLPKQNPPFEEETEDHQKDPRWELVQQLIEYKRLKEQAEELEILISRTNELIPRIVLEKKQHESIPKLKPSDSIELWNAFNNVLQRLADRMVVEEIYEEQISISEQMNFILLTMAVRPQFLFSSLFAEEKLTTNLLIATFLAILELSRLNKLYLQQTETFGDILCLSREGCN